MLTCTLHHTWDMTPVIALRHVDCSDPIPSSNTDAVRVSYFMHAPMQPVFTQALAEPLSCCVQIRDKKAFQTNALRYLQSHMIADQKASCREKGEAIFNTRHELCPAHKLYLAHEP